MESFGSSYTNIALQGTGTNASEARNLGTNVQDKEDL